MLSTIGVQSQFWINKCSGCPAFFFFKERERIVLHLLCLFFKIWPLPGHDLVNEKYFSFLSCILKLTFNNFIRVVRYSIDLFYCLYVSSSVLQSLKESFDEALRRDDVKAIVVTGKFKEITLKVKESWAKILSLLLELFNEILILFFPWAGAKGKFSGGFDITAFGRIQGGNGMHTSSFV